MEYSLANKLYFKVIKMNAELDGVNYLVFLSVVQLSFNVNNGFDFALKMDVISILIINKSYM